jgi:hypothetical protein
MARGNPGKTFPTDEPLSPSEMIGRAHDVHEIKTRLEHGTNLVIAAPRRTGKTTVSGAALALLKQEDVYVVSLDLFRIGSLSELATAMTESVGSNRPAVRRALNEMKQAGKTLYEAFSMSVGAKLASPEFEGFEFNVLPRIQSDPEAQIDYALALPQKIAALDKKKLVINFDEFQDIDRIGDSHKAGWGAVLKRKLRAELQQSPNVTCLFTGSYEHMMVTLFSKPDEPFYQYGSLYKIDQITHDEWVTGLTQKFVKAGTSISATALERVIALGGGHPRSTMLIAHNSLLMSVFAETEAITDALVDQGYEAALQSERAKHDAWTERIRSLGGRAVNRFALPVIQAIATGTAPYSLRKHQTDISRPLNALRDAGFIAEVTQHQWHVIDPMFADYLRRMRIR